MPSSVPMRYSSASSSRQKRIMPDVLSTASAIAVTSGRHSGCTTTLAPGMRRPGRSHVVHLDQIVGGAEARPQDHLASGLLGRPGAQVAVGGEDDLPVRGDGLHDLHGVGAGAADVGQRLDRRRGVDVADHDRARVLGLERLQPLHVDHVGHGAAGAHLGQDDRPVGSQDGRRLGHEVHAAEHDHPGRRGRRLAGQTQRVAQDVGHVLHFRALVVVRQDDGLLLAGQPADLRLHAEWSMACDLDARSADVVTRRCLRRGQRRTCLVSAPEPEPPRTVLPLGRTRSGASSARGSRTKRRSSMRGCGTSRSASAAENPWYQRISTSTVRGPQLHQRARGPARPRCAERAASSSRGSRVVCSSTTWLR